MKNVNQLIESDLLTAVISRDVPDLGLIEGDSLLAKKNSKFDSKARVHLVEVEPMKLRAIGFSEASSMKSGNLYPVIAIYRDCERR